jgi:hypothetical protein
VRRSSRNNFSNFFAVENILATLPQKFGLRERGRKIGRKLTWEEKQLLDIFFSFENRGRHFCHYLEKTKYMSFVADASLPTFRWRRVAGGLS